MENDENHDINDGCPPEVKKAENYVAISDYNAAGPEQLSLSKGHRVKILQKTNESWWWAELDGNNGYVPTNHIVTASEGQESCAWQDEEYFGSYGNLKLHHEMLSDQSRTLAYRDAIIENADSLRGKVVLDVGCGTGILSMMCARHGEARKVYAVEASDIGPSTEKVVEHNNLADKITVIHEYAEKVELEDKVDLIISEWMGTILLFEMMIESVLVMRDKFLKDDGKIWPSAARLFLVPCSAHEEYRTKVEFWNQQYGFDFSVLKDVAKDDLLLKPKHDYILPASDCLSEAESVLDFDLKSVCIEDLEEHTSDFKFVINKGSELHGFCTWFEVEFCPFDTDKTTIFLNTGPEHKLTHWKQNLFLLDSPVKVSSGDKLEGSIRIYRNQEFRRHLRVDLNFTIFSGQNTGTVAALTARLDLSTLPCNRSLLSLRMRFRSSRSSYTRSLFDLVVAMSCGLMLQICLAIQRNDGSMV